MTYIPLSPYLHQYTNKSHSLDYMKHQNQLISLNFLLNHITYFVILNHNELYYDHVIL